MTEGTAVAGAAASASDATVSIQELEDAYKSAVQRELDAEPDKLIASAERSLEKAKLAVKHAELAVEQAKKDAAALRKERAAAAEKENG